MRKFHFAATLMFAAASSTVLIGCGDDDPTTPASALGTYTLRTIDGEAPPVVLFEDDLSKDEVLAGSVLLATGNSCTVRITFRETDKQSNEEEESEEVTPCTFSISGSTITFNFGVLGLLSATISGDTITIDTDDEVWVFRK